MLLYLTFILTSEFKLKHATSNLFIGLDNDYPRWVTQQRSNTFEEKPSRVDGEKIITVKELKNKVWDIEGNGKYLIFYPEHGEVNQRFTIVKLSRGNVRIKSANGQCIVYNEGEKKFERNDCADESMTQVFVLTDANGVAIGGAWGAGGEGGQEWGNEWGNEWGSGWGAGNGLFGDYKMNQKMALDELGRNARFLDAGIMSGGMYGSGRLGDKGMYGGGYSGSFMSQKLDGMFDTLPAIDKQRLLRMYYQNAGSGSQSGGRYSTSNRTPSSYSFYRSF